MSTDLLSDADAEPRFEPHDGEHVESEGRLADENEPTTDPGTWKIECRECSELVAAKPYCCECGAARPADGDYYVAEEVEG